MALIKSISGIRGTIGGIPGFGLTPLDIVKFTSAYAAFIKGRLTDRERHKVVIGRDARLSGEMVSNLVSGTLIACGVDVVDASLASTPTVEMAVVKEGASGGIVLTASHNPKEWNALKLLNERGEFISDAEGKWILERVEKEEFEYSTIEQIGLYNKKEFTKFHLEEVLSYPLVDVELIKSKGYTVVVDGVNSVGGVIVPELLEELGVRVIKVNCQPNGHFAHNPEPLPHNLTDLTSKVVEHGAHLGIAVDPDVDRLALICQDGTPFGEEYTLVAVADYILSNRGGSSVSNLSSTRALRDLTNSKGYEYYASAVGEVNVVTEMKRVKAVIGGEGNGGIIVPDFHYGRDALIGIALFLSHLAKSNMSASELRATYPNYEMAKKKVDLSDSVNIDKILESIKTRYKEYPIIDIDGIKIEFAKERGWVHLRKSNTEPIIRVYSEAPTLQLAESLADQIINEINII